MCEVEMSSTWNLHSIDIKINHPQPCLFTSNALTPHTWHPSLPHDVWEMAPRVRQQLPADIKAVFKRVLFGVVRFPLIAEADRQSFITRRAESINA